MRDVSCVYIYNGASRDEMHFMNGIFEKISDDASVEHTHCLGRWEMLPSAFFFFFFNHSPPQRRQK